MEKREATTNSKKREKTRRRRAADLPKMETAGGRLLVLSQQHPRRWQWVHRCSVTCVHHIIISELTHPLPSPLRNQKRVPGTTTLMYAPNETTRLLVEKRQRSGCSCNNKSSGGCGGVRCDDEEDNSPSYYDSSVTAVDVDAAASAYYYYDDGIRPTTTMDTCGCSSACSSSSSSLPVSCSAPKGTNKKISVTKRSGSSSNRESSRRFVSPIALAVAAAACLLWVAASFVLPKYYGGGSNSSDSSTSNKGIRSSSSSSNIALSSLRQQQVAEMVPGVQSLSASTDSTTSTSASDSRDDATATVASSPTPVSFAGLARRLVPEWYNSTVEILPVISPRVYPDEVYLLRKTLLKTRDMMDAFGPVYPNAYNETKTTIPTNTVTIDLWYELRHWLALGYRRIGEFQDLNNAHIRHTNQQMDFLRMPVLMWLHGFETFRARVGGDRVIMDFLGSARYEPGGFCHGVDRESHLFWDGYLCVDDHDIALRMMTAVDGTTGDRFVPASSVLRKLLAQQLDRALGYWRVVEPFRTIHPDMHDEFHNLRKQLRGITDEFDVLGCETFIETTASTSPFANCSTVTEAVDAMKVARKLLGDINDDYTALEFYRQYDFHHGQQAKLVERIHHRYSHFKRWMTDDRIPSALEHLQELMATVDDDDLSATAQPEAG